MRNITSWSLPIQNFLSSLPRKMQGQCSKFKHSWGIGCFLEVNKSSVMCTNMAPNRCLHGWSLHFQSAWLHSSWLTARLLQSVMKLALSSYLSASGPCLPVYMLLVHFVPILAKKTTKYFFYKNTCTNFQMALWFFDRPIGASILDTSEFS